MLVSKGEGWYLILFPEPVQHGNPAQGMLMYTSEEGGKLRFQCTDSQNSAGASCSDRFRVIRTSDEFGHVQKAVFTTWLHSPSRGGVGVGGVWIRLRVGSTQSQV